MRNERWCLMLLCGLLAGCATGRQESDLAWLGGDWAGDAWGGRFQASYATTGDGGVMSYSRLIRDGSLAYYEFEVFTPDGDDMTLQPFPGGKRADGFRLTSSEPWRAVFENPEKDYPTRIVYQRSAPDRLVITLDDPHGGSEKREVFELRAQPR